MQQVQCLVSSSLWGGPMGLPPAATALRTLPPTPAHSEPLAMISGS